MFRTLFALSKISINDVFLILFTWLTLISYLRYRALTGKDDHGKTAETLILGCFWKFAVLMVEVSGMKKVLIFLFTVLLAVSCSKSDGGESPSSYVQPSLVRLTMPSEPDSLDPYISTASDTEAVMHNVYEGLVLFNEDGEIIPGLAESWQISDDGLEYTFHLRDDVTFHNGKHFSSEDVAYSYGLLSGLTTGTPLSSRFSIITAIDTPDDYTVTFHLSAANAAFLEATRIAVIPSGYTDSATSPVGTGPYKFVEYVPGQRIVLERNDLYYDSSREGKIERAEVYIMTDESAIVTALQSGQLDMAQVTGMDAEILERDFTIHSNPQNMVCLFALNNAIPPFNDIRVRQAINYAVNKEDIINGAFDGYATRLDSNFSPVMGLYYNSDVENYYPYDPAKAKELLAEAGYERGFSFTITVPANYQQHVSTAQIIAEELKAVGIDARLQLVEWGSWLEDVYTNGNYETTVIGLTGKLDPYEILTRFVSDYSRNFFHYDNSEFDTLIEEAMVESDESERIRLYKDCQMILTEDAVCVWTCDPNLVIATRKDLKGYKAYPLTFTDISALYYEDETS